MELASMQDGVCIWDVRNCKEQEQLHNLQGLLVGSKMQKAEC